MAEVRMSPSQPPQSRFTPNPDHVAQKRDEANDTVSIEYLKVAVEAMKGQNATAKQIADCADIFWEWSQSSSWNRG
jgi:hypothetical protein